MVLSYDEITGHRKPQIVTFGKPNTLVAHECPVQQNLQPNFRILFTFGPRDARVQCTWLRGTAAARDACAESVWVLPRARRRPLVPLGRSRRARGTAG